MNYHPISQTRRRLNEEAEEQRGEDLSPARELERACREYLTAADRLRTANDEFESVKAQRAYERLFADICFQLEQAFGDEVDTDLLGKALSS